MRKLSLRKREDRIGDITWSYIKFFKILANRLLMLNSDWSHQEDSNVFTFRPLYRLLCLSYWQVAPRRLDCCYYCTWVLWSSVDFMEAELNRSWPLFLLLLLILSLERFGAEIHLSAHDGFHVDAEFLANELAAMGARLHCGYFAVYPDAHHGAMIYVGKGKFRTIRF